MRRKYGNGDKGRVRSGIIAVVEVDVKRREVVGEEEEKVWGISVGEGGRGERE